MQWMRQRRRRPPPQPRLMVAGGFGGRGSSRCSAFADSWRSVAVENRGVHGTSGLSRTSSALPSAGATTNHDDGADGDLRKPHGSWRTARFVSSSLHSNVSRMNHGGNL